MPREPDIADILAAAREGSISAETALRWLEQRVAAYRPFAVNAGGSLYASRFGAEAPDDEYEALFVPEEAERAAREVAAARAADLDDLTDDEIYDRLFGDR